MILRPTMFVGSALVLAPLVGFMVGIAPSAAASPSEFGTQEPSLDPDGNECFYAITPPQLVMLPGGAKSVTSTLNPTTCTGAAQPTDVIVCLSTPEDPGKCATKPGFQQIQVFISTSTYSGKFTAKGLGCWNDPIYFRSECRPSEVSTTL